MARIKTPEIAAFLRDGTKVRAGNLRALECTVYSYALPIADVDRATRTVAINPAAVGRSMTTSCHLSAVRRAAAELGFTLTTIGEVA